MFSPQALQLHLEAKGIDKEIVDQIISLVTIYSEFIRFFTEKYNVSEDEAEAIGKAFLQTEYEHILSEQPEMLNFQSYQEGLNISVTLLSKFARQHEFGEEKSALLEENMVKMINLIFKYEIF